MRAVDVIRRKRDGGELDAEAIQAFVTGATDGTWADYQLTALLMAIVLRGMSIGEAAALTGAMMQSGARLDLSEFAATAVDKHSTGGVGDKLSLVLAPLAAACGALVPMMSGRGLGHTGGTLDKLESIAGFRTRLSLDETRAALRATGCALIGQTDQIAPADRTLYALRDVTATVESIPLICASILSKKIAEGIGALVMDVKVGRGAFMKTVERARELASWLVDIAGRHGVRTEAVLTRMDAPLGRAVGNANEVVEAVETLKGRGPIDVELLSVNLASRMLVLSGVAPALDDAEGRVRAALESGRGLEKLRAIIEHQGGDPRVVDDYRRLPQSRVSDVWHAPAAGVVTGLDAELIGRAAVALGAGRYTADAAVDPAAGIDILATVGTSVEAGAPMLRMSAASRDRLDAARSLLQNAVGIGERPEPAASLVFEVIPAGTRVAGSSQPSGVA
jgi:pyrimidine-nucleoside phosphorylase